MAKNVNVYIPKGQQVYYANFRAKRNDPLRGVISVQVNRSTGSPDRKTAQAIANRMRDQERLGLFGALPKLRDDCPTVGQLIDRYLAHTRISTAAVVARDFLRVVAEGAGILDPKEMERARDLRLSVLTADSMLAFRDRKGQTRTVESINKVMRSARSVFSKRAREHYRGMKLPASLEDWLRISPLEGKADHSFRRVDSETLARMDKDAHMMLRLARWQRKEGQRQRWLNAWATYWLMRRCGLRNDEVSELRWDWLRESADRVLIELVERPYWSPKGSSGLVPMGLDLFRQIKEIFGPRRDGEQGYVLLGTPNARWQGAHLQINHYVRRYLPDRNKGAYELRKQWGSEMARNYGLETAATLLRHADIKTSWEHYYDDLKLEKVKPL